MSTAKNKIFHYAKVGIGTESPQKQLQILGDSDTCLRITSSSNGAASLQLGDVDDTVKGAITFLNSDNSLRIRGHNNDDRIVIKSDGKVGINEDAPQALLHVATDNGQTLPTISDSFPLIVTKNSNSGIAIIAKNDAKSILAFGDTDDADRGKIQYVHTSGTDVDSM